MSRDSETTLLLDAWYEGDSQALEVLLERHLPTIRAIVRKRLSSYIREREETGDLVQEAMIKFLASGPLVRIENEKSFLSFMVVVVENILRDRYDFYTAQRRGGTKPVTLSTRAPRHNETPSRIASQEEEKALVRVGLEFLSTNDRAIIFLRRWQGLEFERVAETLAVSVESAKKRYQRAVRQLTGITLRLREGELDLLLSDVGVQ